ncbi:MAG TPA: NUDIX domain-containing protein [Pyrinomonadaceae bacterium]|nr:NUDIX domain-containing protein [Pyrinomonadaceae bacterium]
MPTAQDTESRAAVKEFLLAEYHNVADSFWKNEQTGETRVNWFIGIVTAAVGGLFGLTTAEKRPHGEPLRLIYLAALFALLSFGIITLLRVMKRNETTDGYKKDSKRIRRLFAESLDDAGILRNYGSFGDSNEPKETLRKLGGLSHTVSTINSLLFAGIAAAAIYPFGFSDGIERAAQIRLTYLIPPLVFGLAFVGQFFWIRRGEEKSRKRVRTTTHAGGIVFSDEGGKVQYLLVRPSKKKPGKDEWLLPKGHIEAGEEQWQAAVREVREEAGVVGHLICPVGIDSYEVEGKPLKVKFYLLRSEAKAPRAEDRKISWVDFKGALKDLTYLGSKQLLVKAELKRRKAQKEYRRG